ncbi:hypothetical protein [Aquiflexum sp.]|uniref:hypothetical protein n=1 Tax=Aquiflexum sp. TaxID=1872584 RepID=UPI0035940B95
MKNPSLYSIACLFLFFSACQEKEELFSPNLIGTWEIANWNESIERESVVSFIFKSDGTYTYQWTDRLSKEDDNVGYQLLHKGFFSSLGDQLSLMPREIFYPPIQNNGPPFGPKEELVKADFSSTQVDRMQFRISEDGQELLIYADDPQALDMLYTKVE